MPKRSILRFLGETSPCMHRASGGLGIDGWSACGARTMVLMGLGSSETIDKTYGGEQVWVSMW